MENISIASHDDVGAESQQYLSRFETLSEDIKTENRNKRIKILFEDVSHVVKEQVSGEGASCL